MRAAGAHRHAEALRVADHDVGIELAGGHQQRQRQQVGRNDEGRALGMRLIDVRLQVVDHAVAGRVLGQDGEVIVLLHQLRSKADHDLQAQRRGTRAHHFDRLRMAIAGDDEGVGLGLHAALGQRHRLGRGGGFVEHRRVGDGHAGQVADHGLEVHQRFHAALRDLCLVGRVRRVPGRVLEDVALDDARRERAVVALADEALQHPVLCRHGAQFGQRPGFAGRRRQCHRLAACDRSRHHGFDQRAAREVGQLSADHRQHVLFIVGRRADVAGLELAGAFECVERLGGGHQHGATFGAGKWIRAS